MKKHEHKKPAKKPAKKLTKKQKILIILGVVLVLVGVGVAVYFVFFNKTEEPVAESVPEEPVKEVKYYSRLTGEEMAKGADETPLYCVQTPNGMDGARPQVGLGEAKVVFEAIAEAGITRFAAIYQSPESSAIGPIRSLRPYYLEWDTPFGCTVVHAGGSDEAIAALRVGGYREVDEDYVYNWRDYSAFIAPNNLFTSPSLLAKNSASYGYEKADYTAWPRMLPEEAKAEAEKVAGSSAEAEDGAEKEDVEEEALPAVSKITLNYGGYADFNPVYTYDAETNSYIRSYASGAPHQTYNCPAGIEEPNFPRDCTLGQLAPKVVIAMKVTEYLDTDGYHHVIKTTGSGEAVIFQNGTAIPATWKKDGAGSQIVFTDDSGKEVKLAPGQTWITVLPMTGTIVY